MRLRGHTSNYGQAAAQCCTYCCAAPCLPLHPPRTYRVKPILGKELFQCAEYVGPVALHGVSLGITYATREYLIFKPNNRIHELSRSGGFYVADRSLSFNSTIYLVCPILFESWASFHPEDSGMLFPLSSLQRFCRHSRWYPSLLPTLLKLAQLRQKAP